MCTAVLCCPVEYIYVVLCSENDGFANFASFPSQSTTLPNSLPPILKPPGIQVVSFCTFAAVSLSESVFIPEQNTFKILKISQQMAGSLSQIKVAYFLWDTWTLCI